MRILHKYQNALGVAAIALVLAAIIAGMIWESRPGTEHVFVPYGAFLQAVQEGQVATVQLSDGAQLLFTMVESEGAYTTPNPRRTDLKEHLLLAGVYVTEVSAVGLPLPMLGLVGLLAGGVLLFSRKRAAGVKERSGAGSLGAAALTPVADRAVNFTHMAGNPEAKESVQDIVAYLRDPVRFSRYGARMPRGILLHGKPGTGKTLMARAMAGEAGVPFYAVSGSDFVQMYVGVGAARVRELFAKARSSEDGRAVIFIDEIDALGKKRGEANSNDEREQTLNALLTEMQGFSHDQGIVVIAATNRPDTLDEALLRPGRFDRRVEVALPDLAARRQILALHAQDKPLDPTIDLEKLARDTVYFSGAMLEGLLNDAAIHAARRQAISISPEDINTAFYTAVAGPAKHDRTHQRDFERTVTAWHESGHALAAALLCPESRVTKLTIVPSSNGVGGFCLHIPPERMFHTKQELARQIMVLYAGRCAEELHFGKDQVTTGAANDIEKATATVLQVVQRFGMGTSLLDQTQPALNNAATLQQECTDLAHQLYNDTLNLLHQNMPTLQALAAQLLEKETLDEEEVAEIIKD